MSLRARIISDALGHHLTTCIKTGRCCTYTPDPERPVAWVLR